MHSLYVTIYMIYIPKTSIRFVHNKECILAQLTLKDCLGCEVIPWMWPLQQNRYSEGKDAVTFLFSIIVYTFETMCFCHRPYTTISMLVRSAAVLLYITVQSHKSSRFSQAKVAISFECLVVYSNIYFTLSTFLSLQECNQVETLFGDFWGMWKF